MSPAFVALVVIASGAAFMGYAQVARARAVAARGASVRRATGIAQLVPYLFWVPYAVTALRPGPELDIPDAIVAAGLALAVSGAAFAIWAVATLGRHYDLVLEIHREHELVRRGPFEIVRHPVYTGLALHFVGACVATGNLLLIAGTALVTLPSLYLRARNEEGLLRDEFGEAYGRYAREVPMLLPGLRWPGGKT